MALIKCPECDSEISDKAPSCPKCGYPIAKDFKTVSAPTRKFRLPSILSIVGSILLLIIIIALIVGGTLVYKKHHELINSSVDDYFAEQNIGRWVVNAGLVVVGIVLLIAIIFIIIGVLKRRKRNK
jgi:TRAP-type C4-dicarboxylate transport system permease small subunit